MATSFRAKGYVHRESLMHCVGSAMKSDLKAQRAMTSQSCAAQSQRKQSTLADAWENTSGLVSGKSAVKSVCVWQPHNEWCDWKLTVVH